MMAYLGKILADFFGLVRVCGWGIALRWLGKVITHFGECKRTHSLQPVDRAMGDGPFPARYGSARANMVGEQSISGLREIWIRDVYLAHGFLSIPPDAVVVDFGANMGNFTMLALAHGPGVRVVSVEPFAILRKKLQRQVSENGWEQRSQVCPHFVGGRTDKQQQLQASPETAGAEFISEEQFIQMYNLTKIDLIKCDIEGSEFELLHPGSRLLAMARQLAIEVHAWGGNMDQFTQMIRDQGFEVMVRHSSPDDRILNARRVSPTPVK